MNALAAFDRDRADVTARVSFALGSVLARVVLETEQCRRALADAESTSYTDEETGNTAENPEACSSSGGRHYFHLPWDPSLSCGTGKRKTNYSAD